METVIAILVVVALVLAVDRLFRRHFRQESEDTVGRRQRIQRGGSPRPMGEVIDELQGAASDDERQPS